MTRDTIIRTVEEELMRGLPNFGDSEPLWFQGKRVMPGGALIALLSDLPEMQRFENRNFHQINSYSGLSPSDIARALLGRAFENGATIAVDQMYEFLDAEETPCIEVCLLGGIVVSDTVQLCDAVFVAPLKDVPSSSLARYLDRQADQGNPLFSFTSPIKMEDSRLPGAALYRMLTARPMLLETNAGFPEFPGDPMLMYTLASLLTIAGPSSPMIFRSYVELANGHFLKGYASVGVGLPPEETRVSENVPVNTADLHEMKSVVRAYLELDEKTRQALDVPLHRLNEAVRHRNIVDRALDLGIALEALLLSKPGSKEQLSLQFRLRGAWLLGVDGVHRTSLLKQFGKLYDYRSAAAHSGAIRPKNTTQEDVATVLLGGLQLCSSAIKLIIARGGYPDWDALVVGAGFVVDGDMFRD